MSIGHKYSNLDLKKALITWRHILHQGPEFDIDGEKVPITNTDCLWIIENFTQIANSLDQTYFYTIHGGYPPSWEGNLSRSQLISDMNNSYNTHLIHYYKLRQILEHSKNQTLLSECDRRITMTRMKIKPEPCIHYDLKIHAQTN
jgi:hypothetical protein